MVASRVNIATRLQRQNARCHGVAEPATRKQDCQASELHNTVCTSNRQVSSTFEVHKISCQVATDSMQEPLSLAAAALERSVGKAATWADLWALIMDLEGCCQMHIAP